MPAKTRRQDEGGERNVRLTDIGHQLKAFRMESGLKADEIAQRLGISRAALYRYEKGEVIKLDTVQRLAELLKVSPLSLLGIGVEYYQRQAAFFERLRQLEENADTILQVGGAPPFLRTDDDYHRTLVAVLRRTVEQAPDEPALPAIADATIQALEGRRRGFASRQPSMIVLLTVEEVDRLLTTGLGAGIALEGELAERARRVTIREIEAMVGLLKAPPMDFQIGIVRDADVNANFSIMRQRDRSMLAINPFPADGALLRRTGVAVVTGAAEAVTSHQRVAEALWRNAIKGEAAAALLGEVLDRHA